MYQRIAFFKKKTGKFLKIYNRNSVPDKIPVEKTLNLLQTSRKLYKTCGSISRDFPAHCILVLQFLVDRYHWASGLRIRSEGNSKIKQNHGAAVQLDSS